MIENKNAVRFERQADEISAKSVSVVVASWNGSRTTRWYPMDNVQAAAPSGVKIGGDWYPVQAFSQFSPGMRVEAWCLSKRAWRPACVDKPEPHSRGGCDGAYIYWSDMQNPRDYSESSGGWQSSTSMRAV